jgi:phenylalanyl-tRNA synthetase beta chain
LRISFNWLKEFVDIELTVQQISDRLTMAGLEVEGLEYLGEGIKGVVVGRIMSTKPHPNADKLTLCEVDNGAEVLSIVCGAKNMKAGDKVPLAQVGATLPGGMKIEKAKLRGIASFGMLCSEKELGLAKEASGLMILPGDAVVGEDIVKAVGLDDWAMEINVTPNRPDCLCILGIAREAAALTRQPLKLPKFKITETGSPIGGRMKVTVEDGELCPRYAGRLITGIKVGPSPLWMQRRLQAVGVRSTNNVVDATNFVMMELGQPLHAFDYRLLAGQEIIVRGAQKGEMFTTLDGVDRELSEGMLLICDVKRPVALAGVMGGQNSEVTDETTDIFLESAYFNPSSVRKTSKKLGLHTEASHRFERGTDPEGVINALGRAAAMIAELAGGETATGAIDEYPDPVNMPVVTLRTSRVNALLGVDLDKDEIADIMNRLRIKVHEEGPESLLLQAPTFRPDLTREIDFVEEAARVHGYGKIKSSMPEYRMAAEEQDKTRAASARARAAMYDSGFSEVINYSFMDPRDFDKLGLPEDDFRRKTVTLQNPLSVEQSVMRTSLLPSLLSNLSWNLSRGVKDLKIFELSRVFLRTGTGLPNEPLNIGGLACGIKSAELWEGKDKGMDFYDMKGAVEQLLDVLRVPNVVFTAAEDMPILHPGKAARLMVGGRGAGYIGQVHPDVTGRYDLPPEVYVFELDLQSLIEVGPEEVSYKPLPRYPAVERDIAVIVPADVTSFAVLKTIESLKLGLVDDVRLFDYYEGKPIPAGMKSLAYSITYRSPERTLTDEEVNLVHKKVVEALKDRLGAEIREQ